MAIVVLPVIRWGTVGLHTIGLSSHHMQRACRATVVAQRLLAWLIVCNAVVRRRWATEAAASRMTAHRRIRSHLGETERPMSTCSASVDLPPTVRSVPVARRLVLDLLWAWDAPHDRDDAALLVTELVTNVVDHVEGEASLTLELELSDDWLRIAVADGSAVRPVIRELDHEYPRGRGLRLVQAIADRWGSEEHRGGKRVWLELAPRR
jgi:anti-sigma regulatory factor (Ser/Thr protein kinase)